MLLQKEIIRGSKSSQDNLNKGHSFRALSTQIQSNMSQQTALIFGATGINQLLNYMFLTNIVY